MHRNISALFLKYARLDRKRTSEGLTGLEEQVWMRLQSYLTQRLCVGLPASATQRSSIRVATDLPCVFGPRPFSCDASITNLSRSGVFIRTDSRLALGNELWMRNAVAGSSTIEVAGVVASSIGEAGSPERGMGVVFAPMAPDTLRALDDLYLSSIVQRFGEPTENEGPTIEADLGGLA